MPILSLAEQSLLVFNFLPSRTLHPSRFADYGSTPYIVALAAMPEYSSIWHRRWSRLILQHEGLLHAPVMDPAATGLAVAVLEDDALMSLIRRVGIVLCAPRLRYAISGTAVRALQEALGQDALHWVKEGRSLCPGLPGALFKDAGEAVRNVDSAGHAAVSVAFQSASPDVARRFFLKLPSPRVSGMADVPAPGAVQAEGVEAIAREVAASIDSETAMSLVMALHGMPDSGGVNGISC